MQEYRLPKSVSNAKLLLGEESKVWKQAIIEAESNNFFQREISPASSVMAARSMLMTLSALRKSIVMPVIISMPTV